MTMMKLVLIVSNITISEDVQKLLKELDISCFTRIPRLEGVGVTAGARFDNNIWPGANSALFVVVPRETAVKLMEAVAELRKREGREGVKAFMLSVDDMTGEV